MSCGIFNLVKDDPEASMELEIIAITLGLISILLAGTAIYLSSKHEKRTKHYANEAQQHLNQTREIVSKIHREVKSISHTVRRQIDGVLKNYGSILDKLVSKEKKPQHQEPKNEQN